MTIDWTNDHFTCSQDDPQHKNLTKAKFYSLLPKNPKITVRIRIVSNTKFYLLPPKKGKAKRWMEYWGFEWSNTTLSLEEIPTCPMSLFWKYLNPLWGGGNGSQDLAKFWQRIKNTISDLKDTDHNVCLDWANDIMMVVKIEWMRSWGFWIEQMRSWWLERKSSLKILLGAARSSIIIGGAQIVKEFSQHFFSIPFLQPTSTLIWFQTFQRARQDI